jgi:hypothetical protein
MFNDTYIHGDWDTASAGLSPLARFQPTWKYSWHKVKTSVRTIFIFKWISGKGKAYWPRFNQRCIEMAIPLPGAESYTSALC